MKITSENQFTLFEHFHTDHLGHGRNKETIEDRLSVLDRFLYHVIKNIPNDCTLLICSDHGNIENTSIFSDDPGSIQ